jgi:hypothetical protein
MGSALHTPHTPHTPPHNPNKGLDSDDRLAGHTPSGGPKSGEPAQEETPQRPQKKDSKITRGEASRLSDAGGTCQKKK